MYADQQRKMKDGLSKTMKREVEHRTCPNCKRKGGLGRFVFDESTSCGHRTCRYCGYIRSTDPNLNGTFSKEITK